MRRDSKAFIWIQLLCSNLVYANKIHKWCVRFLTGPYDEVYADSVIHLSYIRYNQSGTLYSRKPSFLVLLWACFICVCRSIHKRMETITSSFVQYNVVELTGDELVCIEFHNGIKIITDHDFSFDDIQHTFFIPVYVCAEFVIEELDMSMSHYDVSLFMNTFYTSCIKPIGRKSMTINDIARLAFALKYLKPEIWTQPSIRLVVTDLMTLEDTTFVDNEVFL